MKSKCKGTVEITNLFYQQSKQSKDNEKVHWNKDHHGNAEYMNIINKKIQVTPNMFYL